MNTKLALNITDRLGTRYKNTPSLNYNSAYELLVAVVLSAQCTDERVNRVTEKLFKVANTPKQMAKFTTPELEKYIFSCGLYHTKAEHLISLSNELLSRFNGEVPSTRDELLTLDGVGRKTANVVYAVAFGGAAIAVDTHVFRVSARIGFSKNAKTPLETEKLLMKYIPENRWKDAHHYFIYLGRDVCKAGKPDCKNCIINDLCEYKDKQL